jgi:hypothetical protein
MLGKPRLARHRQALDVGDHRGTAERHGTQAKEGEEQLQRTGSRRALMLPTGIELREESIHDLLL